MTQKIQPENDDSVIAALEKLAAQPENLPLTVRMRSWLPYIEAAIDKGASYQQGIEVSVGSFASALHRLRKRAAKTAKDTTATTKQKTPPPPSDYDPLTPKVKPEKFDWHALKSNIKLTLPDDKEKKE